MNVDYSELGNFFMNNMYPYVDVNRYNANNEDIKNKGILCDVGEQVTDAASKNIATSEALNIPVKTEIKVLSHAGDRAFSVYEGEILQNINKEK